MEVHLTKLSETCKLELHTQDTMPDKISILI